MHFNGAKKQKTYEIINDQQQHQGSPTSFVAQNYSKPLSRTITNPKYLSLSASMYTHKYSSLFVFFFFLNSLSLQLYTNRMPAGWLDGWLLGCRPRWLMSLLIVRTTHHNYHRQQTVAFQLIYGSLTTAECVPVLVSATGRECIPGWGWAACICGVLKSTCYINPIFSRWNLLTAQREYKKEKKENFHLLLVLLGIIFLVLF